MLLVGATAQQAPAAQPAAAVVNVDDDDDETDDDDDDGDDDTVQKQVLDSLVNEFQHLVPGADYQTAQKYLIDNQMNLDEALCAYFDDQAS